MHILPACSFRRLSQFAHIHNIFHYLLT
jgi:hypothetical protein